MDNKLKNIFIEIISKNFKIGFIITILIFHSCQIDFGKDEIEKDIYTGIIIDKFQDKNDHYMWTLEIKSDIKYNIIAERWNGLWQYAEIGDSVLKPENTLDLKIRKKNGITKIFKYE